MTLPAPHLRSTAAQRRQQRADFALIKAQAAASPTVEKRRVKARGDDNRARAQKKIKAALAGQPSRPLSILEAAKIRPAEHVQLQQEFSRRIGQLTAGERKALTARQYLLFMSFTVDDLRAIAAP
jgi:hypothetical protein